MVAKHDQEAATVVQDAAVIGVVIAGVLVSFTIPGPFDWGSTLIGFILLAVVVAYGAWPKGLTATSKRRAIGIAAATAFCLLQILGRPLDVVVGTGDDARRLLSHWPHPSVKRDNDIPDPSAGLELMTLWGLLFVVLVAVWYAVERRRGTRRAAD